MSGAHDLCSWAYMTVGNSPSTHIHAPRDN